MKFFMVGLLIAILMVVIAAISMIAAVVVKVKRSKTATSAPTTPATTPPARKKLSDWWKDNVRDKSLIVFLVGNAVIVIILAIQKPEWLLWLYEYQEHKLLITLILALIATVALLKGPKPERAARWLIFTVWMLIIGFALPLGTAEEFWGSVARGAGNDRLENKLADGAVVFQNDTSRKKILEVKAGQESPWVYLSGGGQWTFSCSEKVYVREDGCKEVLVDKKNGRSAHLSGGRPIRFRALDKDVRVEFTRKY